MSKSILNYLRTHESATLSELYQISEYDYYLNWEKHFGQVMSRLVKRGLVERIKPGVFKIGSSKPVNRIEPSDPSQTELF